MTITPHKRAVIRGLVFVVASGYLFVARVDAVRAEKQHVSGSRLRLGTEC